LTLVKDVQELDLLLDSCRKGRRWPDTRSS